MIAGDTPYIYWQLKSAQVVLTVDLPEYNLKTGEIGTVVLVNQQGLSYKVEFITIAENFIAIAIAFFIQFSMRGRSPKPSKQETRFLQETGFLCFWTILRQKGKCDRPFGIRLARFAGAIGC